MFTLLLIFTVQARSIDEVSQEDRLLVECEHQVQSVAVSGGADAVVKAWKTCMENARSNGLENALPTISGHYTMAVIERDYSSWKSSDPLRYAEVVLKTAAQTPGTKIEFNILNEQWQLILNHPEARSTVTGLHSIGMRWLPNSEVSPELSKEFNKKLRRSVADLGLKLPPEQSDAMSNTDIMLMIQASAKHLPPEISDERGTIYRFEANIDSQSLRFKTRGKRGPPIKVSQQVEGPRQDVLEAQCIDAVTAEFAEALLREVLRLAYGSLPIPAP